jgi:hypothetical protein
VSPVCPASCAWRTETILPPADECGGATWSGRRACGRGMNFPSSCLDMARPSR